MSKLSLYNYLLKSSFKFEFISSDIYDIKSKSLDKAFLDSGSI